MGISTETLVCEDVTSCTDLARCHVVNEITVLNSNSYHTVVATIFLVSTASCKAICRVASVRTSDYSPFLFSAILAKVTRPSNATRAN